MDGLVKNTYACRVARPRTFDEQTVLDAARAQFLSTGCAGTSLDAMAAATGLSKGSLYGAFGSKREPFHRVFDDHCSATLGWTDRQLSGDDEQAFERLAATRTPSNLLACC